MEQWESLSIKRNVEVVTPAADSTTLNACIQECEQNESPGSLSELHYGNNLQTVKRNQVHKETEFNQIIFYRSINMTISIFLVGNQLDAQFIL